MRKRLMVALLALLAAPAARADGCKLLDLGTLPVELAGDRAITHAKVNGQDTPFILDTGAFFSIMSHANAVALGLKLEAAPPGFYISGIGGDANVSLTRARDFEVLGHTWHDADFIVGGSDMGRAIIGANLLLAFDADIDLANGKFALMLPKNCQHADLAYWVKDGVYQEADLEAPLNDKDRKARVRVKINGRELLATIDTGAPTTLMSHHAAERAGLDLNAASVAPGLASGFGRKTYRAWIVPIDSFDFGTETVQHSKMQVIDGDLGSGSDAPDMLIGLDFILAHHMYVAASRHKIYFTYNGGRVSALDGAAKTTQNLAAGPVGAAPAVEPALATASDYALRGEAHLSRGETALALADLDAAIRIDAANPETLFARARARLASRDIDGAMGDLNAANALAPNDVQVLLLRASLHRRRKEAAAVEADITAARQHAPEGSNQARAVAGFLIDDDRPAEALPLLDGWIRLHGDDAQLGVVLNTRCWARGLANVEIGGALQDCRRAIKRVGERSALLDSLGLVLLRNGQYAEAVAAYGKALAQAPKLAWSRYGLGLAELRLGQADAGQADMAAARTLNPGIDDRAAKFGLTAPASPATAAAPSAPR